MTTLLLQRQHRQHRQHRQQQQDQGDADGQNKFADQRHLSSVRTVSSTENRVTQAPSTVLVQAYASTMIHVCLSPPTRSTEYPARNLD